MGYILNNNPHLSTKKVYIFPGFLNISSITHKLSGNGQRSIEIKSQNMGCRLKAACFSVNISIRADE
jgi:hypothetical protein